MLPGGVFIKMWNYNSIIKRLKKNNTIEIIMAGKIESGHPLYILQCGTGNKKILFSCGIHGDEPAGVEAVLRYIEMGEGGRVAGEGINKWYNKYQFTIFPCINPTGIEKGTRENIKGIDLNREFGGNEPPEEVRILQCAVEGRQFDLYIDFHEDADGTGFYLYEVINKKGTSIGEKIIETMSKKYPIDMRERIDGFPNCGGVICPQKGKTRFPVSRKNIPLPLYLYLHGTKHCLTLESPSAFPMEDRVTMHLSALELILKL